MLSARFGCAGFACHITLSTRVVRMTVADVILARLRLVEAERSVRAREVGLSAKVGAIKEYQQTRFCHTYADLLGSTRYGPASRFFLDELYGPTDFGQRDAQFARVVPTMVRLFPREVVNTVAALAQLHALSEQLDTSMGRHLKHPAVNAASYVEAWRATGEEPERVAQIDLTLVVAHALNKLTKKPLLRNSLRLMRQPARAAGLGELQLFLERGFNAFKAMSGAEEFISLIESRERLLISTLFGSLQRRDSKESEIFSVFELLPA